VNSPREVWMAQALSLADKAALQLEVPVGAVLVLGDEVIGHGRNEREATGRTTAHAEIRALEDFSSRTGQWRVPPGTELYVTVEPCLMCTGALLWARVDKVFFGCKDPKNAGIEALRPLISQGVYDHRFVEVSGLISEALCADKMKTFFKAKRLQKK
jgi:tRNA(adenine34) deaminase